MGLRYSVIYKLEEMKRTKAKRCFPSYKFDYSYSRHLLCADSSPDRHGPLCSSWYERDLLIFDIKMLSQASG